MRRGPDRRKGNYVSTHGLTYTTEYEIWCGIRKRCNNPKDRLFKYYGARGIKVCERWNSFENFLADMGPRPSLKHSVDRKDNDLGYEPDNCYWATKSQQMRNTRQNRLLTFDGVTLCATAWAERLGLSVHTVRRRIREGQSTEQVLRPPDRRRVHQPPST